MSAAAAGGTPRRALAGYVVGIALVFAGVAAGALLVADVRLAVSDTRSEAQVASARNAAAGAPEAAESRLVLYVEGDDALAAALRRELAGTLGATGPFAGVDVVSAPPAAADHPALVAGLVSREVFWTPLHAAGTVEAAFAYASDRGDPTWRDGRAFVLGGGPTVHASGRVRVTDTTRGLVSRPAYLTHLGREAAARVAEQLRSALTRPASA
jgi:hypothetical protein